MKQNITVLYKINYFERDLYLLDIDGKYTKVYRGSGLNGSRKGKILPFTYLMDWKPRFGEAMQGLMSGWISKSFYFKGEETKHYKNISQFGVEINDFLSELETFLLDYIPTKIDYSDEDFNTNIINIASNINNDMKKLIEDREPFDWSTLIKNEENISNELSEIIDSIHMDLYRAARSSFGYDIFIQSYDLKKDFLKKLLPYLNKTIYVNKEGCMLLRKYLSYEQDRDSDYSI